MNASERVQALVIMMALLGTMNMEDEQNFSDNSTKRQLDQFQRPFVTGIRCAHLVTEPFLALSVSIANHSESGSSRVVSMNQRCPLGESCSTASHDYRCSSNIASPSPRY